MKYFRSCMTLLLVLIIKLNVMAELKTDVPVTSSELLYDGKARLGEGAFWNHETNTFWWVDIEGETFHIYDHETETSKSYPVQQRIGTVVPDKDGNAIVALQDGIYRLFLHDGSLTLLAKADHDPERFRFNDGKCDPAGRLWVGSMPMDGSRETAKLYRFDHDYTLKPMLDGVTISNGIVWTADKTKMYYIDTPTQQVREFRYNNSTGEIEFSRVAVEVPRELGHPDGMSIDENDRLWIGHWAGHAVYCWDPLTGQLIAKVEVAAKNVTACDFGGKNLDKLFITTASVGMSEEEREQLPKSGGMFIAFPGVKGAKSHFFGK
jgi:sugar lactone lactonase YvrE